MIESIADPTGRTAGAASGRRDPVAIARRQAVVLGLVQGPTELLPVSSSAHLILVPWLSGWRWERLDPELRKSFEVALHAGAAIALVIAQRRRIAEELRLFDLRRAAVLGLSFAPAAMTGFALERTIEARLGNPSTTAAGLVVGAVAMVAADLRAQSRGHGDAGPLDGLALGLAQAAALAPGISRNGATLAAARFRCFTREQANVLSRTVALPVIAGAALLKGIRLARRRHTCQASSVLAAGTAASLLSTLACQRLIGLVERDRALWPYAAYRGALAVAVLWRIRRGRRDRAPKPASAPAAAPLRRLAEVARA